MSITNATVPSIATILNVTNSTSPAEVLVNINNYLFNGMLFFLLLFTLWIILYLISINIDNDYPIESAMTTGAVVSVISFFLRAVYIMKDGVVYGLISDAQLWIFPILTIILALIIWANKRD